MPDVAAALIIDALMGLQLGATAQDAPNHFSIEGLTIGPAHNGAREVGVRKLEAVSLRLVSGALVVEIGRLALHQLEGHARVDAGGPRVGALKAATAELSGVKVQGPLMHPRHAGGAGAWHLGPLAAANGTIRAEIVDAHLLFDADVTLPLREGQVNFDAATVEHVGPDSRMGVSRLGLYVDAPNGRSYLYQFASTPFPGVEYERRGALLGPWVSDRGKLQLQAFGEALLRLAAGGPRPGLTDQAHLLLGRTAVQGEVRLGDARFEGPGVQAELVDGAEGHNVMRVHSEAVGGGFTVEMTSLLARNAALNAGSARLACDEIAGALALRLFAEGTQLRFACELAEIKLSGLRLQRLQPE